MPETTEQVEGKAGTGDFIKEWAERVAASYLAQVDRGEHDEQCEFDVGGFYLCHCSKRRREGAGLTKPPTDNLEFPPPCCPRCDEELTHEEGWLCHGCSLSWDSDGDGRSASFTDVFGDDLAAYAERWRSKRNERSTARGTGSSPTQSTEVPEEAVEAAAKASYEDAVSEVGDAWEPEGEVEGVWEAEKDGYKQLFRSKARIAVDAAAPVIRNQERQRIQEALLSNEVVEATAKSRWERNWTDPQGMADWEEAKRRGMPGPAGMLRETRADLIAALDTLDPSGEENVERCGGSKVLVACDCRPGWDGSGCHHEADCAGKVCLGCPDCRPSGEQGEEKREAVEVAWEESGRSALDELFEAITPRDGSEGDLFAAAMLAPHAWAEIKRLRSVPATDPSKEELLSDEAIDAAARAMFVTPSADSRRDARAGLEAAIAVAKGGKQ